MHCHRFERCFRRQFLQCHLGYWKNLLENHISCFERTFISMSEFFQHCRHLQLRFQKVWLEIYEYIRILNSILVDGMSHLLLLYLRTLPIVLNDWLAECYNNQKMWKFSIYWKDPKAGTWVSLQFSRWLFWVGQNLGSTSIFIYAQRHGLQSRRIRKKERLDCCSLSISLV